MSEEIFDRINLLLQCYIELKEDSEQGHASAYEMQFTDFEAIQDFLNLYRQLQDKCIELATTINALQTDLKEEKEKNKELEKENWIMRTVDKQYISKDKIKDKIKYYENTINYDMPDTMIAEYNYIINVLKELLED